MFIFININHLGISWISATNVNALVMNKIIGGDFHNFKIAVAKCTCIIAINARKQVDALAKHVPSISNIPIIELTNSIKIADATDVARRYFTVESGLLPEGCYPSDEQWVVAAAAERGLNILCRAVAGAGKTTTLLLCASRAKSQSHLLLTYNKRLQLDTSNRAKKWKSSANISVMTYHSAAGKSYGTVICNDEQFRHHVHNIPETPVRFNVLLVDEAQDMSVEYFALIRHLLIANPGSRLIVVGDELQSINEYRGAHPGFLTESPNLYREYSSYDWISCRLGISMRLTPSTASFINTHIYNANVIVGGNFRSIDRKPIYIAALGKAAITLALAAAVKEAVIEFGPEGIFILAASISDLSNKDTPIANLVKHHLSGVPLFIASGQDAGLDESLIRGKIAILSFNSSKGCERPCVIIVGLDENYFRYFNKGWKDLERVPNILSVAATRAMSRLVIIAGSNRTLRTIRYEHLNLCTELRGDASPPKHHKLPKPQPKIITVTNLIKHLHPEILRNAMNLIITSSETDNIARNCPRINGHVKFTETGLTEDIRFVYGLLATVLAEVSRTGKSTFGADFKSPQVVASVNDIKPYENQIIESEYNAYPAQFWELITCALSVDVKLRSSIEWTVLAIAHNAFRNGRHHIARQVSHYEWINDEILSITSNIVSNALSKLSGKFEVQMPDITIGLNTIKGIADFVEDGHQGCIWEFKLCELCEEHEIQLACYLAMCGGGNGKLMSITCQETRNVTVSSENAIKLLKILIERSVSVTPLIADLLLEFDCSTDVHQTDEHQMNITFDDLY